ncbi:MAG: UMP kinase [Vallitaleaceae bacterium]|nr:UMP kinase [Vallitaleaceae bacterium]
MEYKKVLLKLSGEALSGNKGKGFCEETVLEVARQVKYLVDQGIQVGIVIGGGNFWRGRSSEKMDRTKADQIGMLATVMNCMYTAEMFRTIGLKTTVMTPFALGQMTKVFEKDQCMQLQAEGEVVFFAGGTGHPYFSTDTAAALRAIETDCDIILLAKNIDGVYDSDPNKNPKAKKYDRISLKEVIDQNLQVMDLTAAIMCLEQKVAMSVFYLNDPDSIIHSIENQTNGTIVYV